MIADNNKVINKWLLLVNDGSTIVCVLEVTLRVSLPFGRRMNEVEEFGDGIRSNPQGLLEKGRKNGTDCGDDICDRASEFDCRQRLLSFRIGGILKAKQNNFWDEKEKLVLSSFS